MLRNGTRALRQSILALAILAGLGQLAARESRSSDVPLVQELIGAWEGNGTLFGRDAGFHMEWTWVLDEQFLHLAFENRIKAADGQGRGLRAWALYQPTNSGGFSGTWFDSRGVTQPLSSTIEDRTLTTEWGTAETEQGRTVYQLQDDGTLTVEDFVLKDGQWTSFGQCTYRRLQQP